MEKVCNLCTLLSALTCPWLHLIPFYRSSDKRVWKYMYTDTNTKTNFKMWAFSYNFFKPTEKCSDTNFLLHMSSKPLEARKILVKCLEAKQEYKR